MVEYVGPSILQRANVRFGVAALGSDVSESLLHASCLDCVWVLDRMAVDKIEIGQRTE